MTTYRGVDYYGIESLLTEEQRMVQDAVRDWVEKEFVPVVSQHHRDGTFPIEVAKPLGEMGVFGATLNGYGCAGLDNVAYGLIMQELERGDSGLRSFASVQSGLVMYPIYAYGSEAQKEKWLPRLQSGEARGCLGLTEPDHGSDPGSMATRAVALGRKLGLSEDDVEVLAYVASVHDVGMGQIDLTVLQEPGSLDDETWARVAMHPLRSAEIVKPIEFQEQVTEIIMAHHERIDGKGYPRGLKGQEIPIGAKIIGVLDAYESMTIGRPYRHAMTHAEALQELRRCAGTQFESRVVEAFGHLYQSEETTKLVRTAEAA